MFRLNEAGGCHLLASSLGLLLAVHPWGPAASAQPSGSPAEPAEHAIHCPPATSAKDCGDAILNLEVTLYYTALEEDYPSGDQAAFRSVSGAVLKRGSTQFYDAAAIEGSARFLDGTVLNYAERIGSDLRWMETSSPFGIDARGCGLVPFRSAAVDPSIVELGTILLLEETRGFQMPDGSRHDGIWVAADTGESILGNRIDLYTGHGLDSMDTVRNFGIGHLQELTAHSGGHTVAC